MHSFIHPQSRRYAWRLLNCNLQKHWLPLLQPAQPRHATVGWTDSLNASCALGFLASWSMGQNSRGQQAHNGNVGAHRRGPDQQALLSFYRVLGRRGLSGASDGRGKCGSKAARAKMVCLIGPKTPPPPKYKHYSCPPP